MSVALPIIEVAYQTGLTLYAVLHNRITGQVWNNSTPAFENFNAAHWAQYAVALTEQTGTGYYSAPRPAGIAGALVSEVIYQQPGGSPATSDSLVVLSRTAGENISAISGDPSAAPTNLQGALSTETQGAVAAGVITVSSFPTNLSNSNVNAYSGMTIRFITGAAAGMAALIATYNPTGGVIVLSGALAVAPSAADKFIIV